MIDSDILTISR